MTKPFIACCSILILLIGCSKSNVSEPQYHYNIDLIKISGEELVVELDFTGHLPDTSYFYLPKIVPGIYDALNYGKFVNNFKAFNKAGDALKINRLDDNGWQIIGT